MVAVLAFIVSILALLATFFSIRYQVITMINVQLADKAKECNSYLGENAMVPRSAHKVSGIVSSIITAKELLDYHLKFKRYSVLIWFNKQTLLEQFYLQLHTSIRVFLEKNYLTDDDINDLVLADQIRSQFSNVKKILEKCVKI